MDLWFPHLFAEIMGRFSEKPPSLTVRFLGSIEELNLFYQDLDAVLVTSDKEALPTVVLEALVRQIPVFSFEDLRGVQEILGETALLARERNGAALAEKVIQFFINPDHPDTLEQWQKAAMARSRLFSLENQWKAFQKVFSGLG
jgi:glycosyltransferase involved in cell wall biosynthesis